MNVVIRHANQDREVVVDQRSPEAVVGDLLTAVRIEAEGVEVDGRFIPAEMALDEAPIPDGSILLPSARHGPPTSPRSAAERFLTVVAGGPSGQRLALTPGSAVRIGRDDGHHMVLDCPTVSALHAIVQVTDNGVTITDAGSVNGTWLDGHDVHDPTPLTVGRTVRLGAVVLRLDGPAVSDKPAGIDRWLEPGNIPFNRPPRSALPPATPTIRGPAAPEEQKATALRIAAIVAPLLMGAVMVVAFGSLRFALFMLMSPVIAIFTFVGGKRSAKKGNAVASVQFTKDLAVLARDLEQTQHQEHDRRESVAPDIAEILRRAHAPSNRLWERRIGHDDVLHLRVGSATVPWDIPIELPDADDPDPRVTEAMTERALIHASPVEVDLSDGGVVGIVGDRDRGLALARSLVCQIAVLHGPADLPMVILTRPDAAAEWDWSKWLPHVRSGSARMISADPDVSAEIVAGIESAWEDAQTTKGPMATPAFGGGKGQGGPVRLYVVDDLELLQGRRAPARTLLRSGAGPAAGIVLAPTEDQLPASCTVVIEVLDDVGNAQVRRPADAHEIQNVLTAGLTTGDAQGCARSLARFEDPELAMAGGSVPAMARLLPLLLMDDVTADDVIARWAEGLPDPGPNGPIGMGEHGTVHLDLRTDGPHGLVGGTTGSGKSELLRSMVAGMAARVDPDHLVFVLVDYKGGSAFDECAGLPHTVGMVTDLDEHLGERALVSLEAELHFRERLFREAGVTDLPEYLKAGATLGPCPRMVVIIDEFATMASELPDFLDALVGIAQRGRSLGVHMILATQRPRGAVNANIKANTNLRIALRVQDGGDSSDIIDTDAAAHISRDNPGRAWIRRGHGDLTLVQSALSTGPAVSGGGSAVALARFAFQPVSQPPPPPAPDDDAPTDLGLLVTACNEAFQRGGYAEPRKPWLPMPSTELSLDEVLAQVPHDPMVVPFGIADDPAAQAQVPVSWQLAQGHLAIFGMVGMGTTTTLQTLAMSIARQHDPDRCHLYGIDFGGGGLTQLTALPHCGAVVTAAQREQQFRLMRMLAGEVDRRRELVGDERDDEPTIVVLIDDVAAMLAEHEGLEGQELVDQFKKVFAEGTGVRILVAVTGNRPNALPLRMNAGVNQKLLLKHADNSDFGQIGVREKSLPSFVPGRAILSSTKQVVQIALPGDADAAVPHAQEAEAGQPARRPAVVAALPAELAFTDLVGQPSEGPPITLPIGLDDATLGAASLVIHPGDHVTICGPPRSGKSTLMCVISAQIRRLFPDVVQLALTDEHRSAFHGWKSLDGCGTFDGLEQYLAMGPSQTGRWVVFVDDAPAVDDRKKILENLVRARPDLHMVVSGRSSELRSGYGHWSRPLRQSRTGVLLQPDLSADGDVFGVRLPRRVPVPFVPGRGYLVVAGEFGLAQFALPPDDVPPGGIA